MAGRHLKLDRDEMVRLTYEYGSDWAINHAKRILHLVSMLSDGTDYNEDAVWLAAYLHDWGGYQQWLVPGVEHYTRSAEVAREFLTKQNCPPDLMELVIECIEFHHGGPSERSIESILTADADALDLLGVVGAARIFAMNFRNLKNGFDAVKRYRNMSVAAISTDKAHELATERIKETDWFINAFLEETFGIY